MRKGFQRIVGGVALGAMLAGVAMAGTPSVGGPPFAEKARSGKSLVVRSEHKNKGTLYYALTGKDPQIFFKSDAPLENIRGQSNRVIGYIVAGGSDAPAKLVGGEWHLPVDSMRTGIKERDGHMASSSWLDAESFPDIVFQLKSVKDVSLDKETEAFATYSATLVGEMTVHGQSRPVTLQDARITFMPESEATRGVAIGDLMAIRVKYSIKLSEYGVKNDIIGGKVAEVIEIDTALYMSTVKPEDQPAKVGEG